MILKTHDLHGIRLINIRNSFLITFLMQTKLKILTIIPPFQLTLLFLDVILSLKV
jgi:hypothetical protein